MITATLLRLLLGTLAVLVVTGIAAQAIARGRRQR